MSKILKFKQNIPEVTTESTLMLNIFSFHEFCNYKTSEITTKRQLLNSLTAEDDVVEEKKKHTKKKLKKKKKLKPSIPDSAPVSTSYIQKGLELGKLDYYS